MNGENGRFCTVKKPQYIYLLGFFVNKRKISMCVFYMEYGWYFVKFVIFLFTLLQVMTTIECQGFN